MSSDEGKRPSCQAEKRRIRLITEGLSLRLQALLALPIFVVLSLMLLYGQNSGNLISCQHDKPREIRETIEGFCLSEGTFTIADAKTGLPKSPFGIGYFNETTDVKIFHNYYMRLPYIFLLLSVIGLIPLMIWRNCEGKVLESLVPAGLPSIRRNSDELKQDILLLCYVFKQLRLTKNLIRRYHLDYILCLVLNQLFIAAQIMIMNLVLSGKFINFGLMQMWSLDQGLFPEWVMCSHPDFLRLSGMMTSVCFLFLNDSLEKAVLTVWFWLLFSFILNLLTLCSIVTQALSPRLAMMTIDKSTVHLSAFLPDFEAEDAKRIRKNSASAWFLMQCIERNVDWVIFAKIVSAVAALDLEDEDDNETILVKDKLMLRNLL